jgi:hypothetical protein
LLSSSIVNEVRQTAYRTDKNLLKEARESNSRKPSSSKNVKLTRNRVESAKLLLEWTNPALIGFCYKKREVTRAGRVGELFATSKPQTFTAKAAKLEIQIFHPGPSCCSRSAAAAERLRHSLMTGGSGPLAVGVFLLFQYYLNRNGAVAVAGVTMSKRGPLT